jgi:8-oxo-dGTP pyrophosphatase MutT (NUDIX family)
MRLRQFKRADKHVTDERKFVYRGKIVSLYLERVTLPNGAVADFEIVQHPGGAAVVALDQDDRVCLLRQFRHVAGGWLWELPAGKLDPGEPPLTTAQRELEEEAGLRAARWEPLGRINSSPGIFTEVIHLFLASGLTRVPARNEIHELIEVHWIPFAEALTLAHTNEITDGKTLVGLFRAQQWRERRQRS